MLPSGNGCKAKGRSPPTGFPGSSAQDNVAENPKDAAQVKTA
jgi:hypothetical protein